MAHVPRVLCPAPLRADSDVELSRERAHHLHTVMRRSEGDAVRAWDGEGRECDAKITRLSHKAGTLRAGQVDEINRESPLPLLLGQAVGRGDRFGDAMVAAIELGVVAVQPLWSEYGLPPLKSERREKKLASWQTQALGAAEQAERTHIPRICEPCDISQWLATAGMGIILHPGGRLLDRELLAQAKRSNSVGDMPFGVLVGPEGGWSEREVAAAEAAGLIRASLGPRILRTEHAGPAMIAMLQAFAGDMAGTV